MFKQYRKEIEKLYIDKADIFHYEEIRNKLTGEVVVDKVITHEDIPCKLSSTTLKPSEHRESHNKIVFTSKLFTSPEYQVKEGAFIIVKQEHDTNSFTAGKPFKHNSHQEIPLEQVGEA